MSLFTYDGLLAPDLSLSSQGLRDHDSIPFFCVRLVCLSDAKYDFEHTQDMQLKNIHIPGLLRSSDAIERLRESHPSFLRDIVFSCWLLVDASPVDTVKSLSSLPVILKRLTKYRVTKITITDKITGINLHVNGLLPSQSSTITDVHSLAFSCTLIETPSPIGSILHSLGTASFFHALTEFDYAFFHLLEIDCRFCAGSQRADCSLSEAQYRELAEALRAQAIPVYVVVNGEWRACA